MSFRGRLCRPWESPGGVSPPHRCLCGRKIVPGDRTPRALPRAMRSGATGLPALAMTNPLARCPCRGGHPPPALPPGREYPNRRKRYNTLCRAGPWSRRYAAMIACGDVDLRCRSTGGSKPPPYGVSVGAPPSYGRALLVRCDTFSLGEKHRDLLKNEGIMNFSLQYPYKLVN